ncbi:MAG: PTS fructose transporter subunit IIA [Spirochaetes bacterium GWD1_61_31]|nr:MAG: PTS fructose transporter subunit IIA [Spirochaetes bacterium GWB1_60_80]OHD44006.1 MAG: PTS fructose transporter subunit IIA [Spirochaetes bacterium GWD1_61_31]OHD46182.1 MAG: PTS fructose transporter subunit IIA [Spirochaetes bacterium GWE1_60_18]OHD60720.1 MAG: PTS fructose transporter subunit IIA [Spirochaetes bacterium GWF1_60_12]HAP43890.1 PTS fructose transporter subunit IIA [Spirochaetaceae bacterium]
MQLSVKDAALILNVSEKTIYRWIKQGVIPSYKINEQFRFNRSELLEWATSRRIKVSPAIFNEETPYALPSLLEALQAGGIAYRLDGRDLPAVLKNVVSILQLPEEVDRDFLFQVLLAREKLGSTGVGDGIAIPHVRNPVVLHVSRPTVTLCFLEHPIDFGAIDGKPVNIFFVVVSPTVKAHLHLLSRLGFLLHDPAFKAALVNQASRDELMAMVAALEKGLQTASASLPAGQA